MTSSTRTAERPSNPSQEPQGSRRNKLAQRPLPPWTWVVVLVASAVVAAALAALFTDFHLGFVFVTTLVLFLVTSYVVTRSRAGRRKANDELCRNLVYTAFILALIPLVSLLWSVTSVGMRGLTEPGFLTSDMMGVSGTTDAESVQEGTSVQGGIVHALVGSLMITLAAAAISVPIGLLTSIYLVEYSRGGPLARAITFFVDVMTGIPSIVAGLFGVAAMSWFLGVLNQAGLISSSRSTMGITAAIALSVLMIPIVVRTTEEMLRVVPNELREASYAMGVRKWRTITKVVLPTAISGIASGVTLALARVFGETAPILVTAGFVVNVNWNLFQGWMTALPVYIYRQFQNPINPSLSEPSYQRAWAAALVLIFVVMMLNLIARIIAKVFAPKTGGR
ncbi:MAG: phosphate ABC transporter permease PstA [Nesterenkonia sp.]|uniref:phosphate ABC transporter permease PstA n=1 Tax=Nesterenkonia marinintestina TaxID=2979865 RepID=UPI0021BEE245|nr:phosphate ABC transporter permease PstA [Nesterenkonia sp. GX14115]MDO5493263.1 phosphate ABC transporter permease PstA [Nesterenkonia sp.]